MLNEKTNSQIEEKVGFNQLSELNKNTEEREKTVKYDFITATEISEFLGIGKTQSYEICKKINKQLDEQGFLTFRGKVPRKALIENLPH